MKERPGSPRVRLFIALDLPEQIVAPLARWTGEAFGGHPDLRPVRPESLHVTLAFLGYMYERDVERLAATAFAQDLSPIELRATQVQPVPRSRPRLFAVQLEDEGRRLGVWQQALSERLHAAGLYEPERRPFWPHVTLARARRGKTPRGIAVPELTSELRRPFPADTVTLYRSTLRPQGAVYEALAKGKKTLVHQRRV
jgi:2'-5' RNA ligase